jgi:hypothetical protein
MKLAMSDFGVVAHRVRSLCSKERETRGELKAIEKKVRLLQKQIGRLSWAISNLGVKMDKKMHKITKRMETAEKDIKANKKGAAVKALKGAEKGNEKLVKIDRDVRDPLIEKCKKSMKKGKRK